MADEDPAPDPAPEPPADLDQRVSRIETAVDRLMSVITGSGDEPDPPAGPAAGAPNIAHEIRAQLDERDRKAREDAEKKGVADELGQVKAKLAELAEKAPEPMPRRVEKIMGWR